MNSILNKSHSNVGLNAAHRKAFRSNGNIWTILRSKRAKKSLSINPEWKAVNWSNYGSIPFVGNTSATIRVWRRISLINLIPPLVSTFNVSRCSLIEPNLVSVASLVPPVFLGPNIPVVATIPNYRVVMRCQFESYPPPQIQWIKMSRTVQDPEGRVLAMDIDNGVNDITTKQLGSTLFESVLSVSTSLPTVSNVWMNWF